jgi:hypothetical protein
MGRYDTVQTIEGPLTNEELRALPVEVSGPLTDAELRLNPVPVSGPLTDAQLRNLPVEVNDTYASFESDHRTLVASADATITFASPVRMVRVSNWDAVNRLLVKAGAIASDTDAAASRVGAAPGADQPSILEFRIATSEIHIRSAGASEVTIEGFH